jgi:hypothetical protein
MEIPMQSLATTLVLSLCSLSYHSLVPVTARAADLKASCILVNHYYYYYCTLLLSSSPAPPLPLISLSLSYALTQIANSTSSPHHVV